MRIFIFRFLFGYTCSLAGWLACNLCVCVCALVGLPSRHAHSENVFYNRKMWAVALLRSHAIHTRRKSFQVLCVCVCVCYWVARIGFSLHLISPEHIKMMRICLCVSVCVPGVSALYNHLYVALCVCVCSCMCANCACWKCTSGAGFCSRTNLRQALRWMQKGCVSVCVFMLADSSLPPLRFAVSPDFRTASCMRVRACVNVWLKVTFSVVIIMLCENQYNCTRNALFCCCGRYSGRIYSSHDHHYFFIFVQPVNA